MLNLLLSLLAYVSHVIDIADTASSIVSFLKHHCNYILIYCSLVFILTIQYKYFIYFYYVSTFICFEPHPALGYSWPFSQKLLLETLRDYMGCYGSTWAARARKIPYPLCYQFAPILSILLLFSIFIWKLFFCLID